MILLLLSFTDLFGRRIDDFQTIGAAKQAYKERQFRKSAKLFGSIEKESWQKWYDMGNAYYKSGAYQKAIEAYKKAQGEAVDDAKRLHNLGNCYFKQRRYDEAIKSYEDALQIEYDEDTRYNLELAKKRKKKRKQQKKRYQKAKNSDKNSKKKEQNPQGAKKKNDQSGTRSTNKKKPQKKHQSGKSEAQKQSHRHDKEKEQSSSASQSNVSAKPKVHKQLIRLLRKMQDKKMPTMLYRKEPKSPSQRKEDVKPW